MMWLLNIMLIITLMIIIYQDFRFRAIDWYVFLILPVLIALQHITEIKTIFFHFMINMLFLTMNSILLFLVFSLKNKKIVNPVNTYIGIGDLLFFAGLALWFSPLNFVVFFTISLLITLATYLIMFKIKEQQSKEIPLAGFISIWVLFLFICKIFTNINFHSDSWILQHLISNGIY